MTPPPFSPTQTIFPVAVATPGNAKNGYSIGSSMSSFDSFKQQCGLLGSPDDFSCALSDRSQINGHPLWYVNPHKGAGCACVCVFNLPDCGIPPNIELYQPAADSSPPNSNPHPHPSPTTGTTK